jgi:MFS family permease
MTQHLIAITAVTAAGRWTTHRRAWIMVALLAMLSALSFIDRLILNVLADPVSKSLNMNDSQLGLLMGTGFAALYSLASLPLAHLIDNRNRKRLVIFGVVLWSAMTMLSAFANSFSVLLLARSGVGIGEAVLTPASVSLIADMYAKDRRTLPIAILTAVGSFMGSASFVVGGLVLMLANNLSAATGMEPWRLTFLIVGVPGFVVVTLFAWLAFEPAREGDKINGNQPVNLKGLLHYLGAHWAFYIPLYVSGSVFSLFIYSMLSWAPTILVRAHGFTATEASLVVGSIMTPIKLVSLVLWPLIAIRIERRSFHLGVPICLFISSLWAIPFFIFTPVTTNSTIFVTGVCLAIVTSSAWAVLPSVGFQIYAPKRMVGRLAAILTFGMNLVGLGIGPLLTVYLGKSLSPAILPASVLITNNPIARGLAIEGAIAIPIMLVGTAMCIRHAKRLPVT